MKLLKNWISNSYVNCIFLVGDYLIWSFTDIERSVGLINTYQLPIHSGMDIVNVTVRCKNCCIISRMNKTHLIWGSIHVIDIQKKEYWCSVWNRGTVVFDWDLFFPVTQIRLNLVLHDTSDAIMQKLTHQYVMINCVECFWEI